MQTEEVASLWLALEVLCYKNSHVPEDSEVTLPRKIFNKFNEFVKVSK